MVETDDLENLTPEESEALDWVISLQEEGENQTIRQKFNIWLHATEENARAWAKISRVYGGIGETKPAFEDTWRPALNKAASSMVVGQVASGRTVRRRRLYGVTALAASVAVSWFIVGSDVRLFFQADQVTGIGQLRTVSLPDGSTVTLAPRSAIAFTSDAHSRTVRLLQGEAWFDVRHSAEQPFHVVAHDLDVMDVGTKFDVQEAERETEVSVESGVVRVMSVNPPAISEDIVAGQTVAISADHLVRRGNADPTMIAGWRDGVLTVQNRTISDVVEAIRPWHRGLLILSGSRLGNRRVTGVYDLRHPQAAIKALADAYGIKITRISPWLVILSES
ncbi:FecR domain-containing protein [Gluconobacter japonicus]|uniref:FecR family protein n=1 Tax=Gluconobacter japonicus TaxID=376620 RepID=UPI0024AE738D|nr:FecR domain-containing protein [Gluconobacter japonicus]MDI6653942.1 FecR domain-containing protein [Gluconobacter japonicus]